MALENISDKCKVVLPLHPRTKAKLIGIGYDFPVLIYALSSLLAIWRWFGF